METQIRKLGRDFANNELGTRWENLDCQNSTLLKDILKQAAGIGVFGFLIEETLGGAGFRQREYCIFLEEISKICAGVAVLFAAHFMGITPVILLKDIEKRNRFLSSVVQSEKKGSPSIFALSLNETKSSKLVPDNIQTVVKQKEGNYLISGNKINVMCGEIANYFTLLGKIDNKDRFVWLIVSADSAGIEVKEQRQKLGLKILPINDVHFNDVEISSDNLLFETDDLQHILDYYKFSDTIFASIALGMMEEAYSASLKYSTERYQGGKIICEHDAIKMMLSEMALAIEVSRQAIYNTSSNILLSVYAAERAEIVCLDAIQIFGGYGYMKDFKIERIFRDAKTYQSIISPFARKMENIHQEIEKQR